MLQFLVSAGGIEKILNYLLYITWW